MLFWPSKSQQQLWNLSRVFQNILLTSSHLYLSLPPHLLPSGTQSTIRQTPLYSGILYKWSNYLNWFFSISNMTGSSPKLSLMVVFQTLHALWTWVSHRKNISAAWVFDFSFSVRTQISQPYKNMSLRIKVNTVWEPSFLLGCFYLIIFSG